MDNAPYNHPGDDRRSKSDIVMSVKGGQRMLEHWQFQWSHGNYGRTQVIILIFYSITYIFHDNSIYTTYLSNSKKTMIRYNIIDYHVITGYGTKQNNYYFF